MLHVKRLTESAKLPTRAYDRDAGFDLYACLDGPWKLYPAERCAISTGIAVAIDPGKVGLIWPRSGMALKDGIMVMAGVIDSGYRGEIKVILHNAGESMVLIKTGDKIAQMLLQPVFPDEVFEVNEFSGQTDRGEQGFGSTGL
jgi:dUTP pyrophosphatase